MTVLDGPAAGFAVLLVIGGAGKLRRPGAIVDALRTLHLPANPFSARALSLAEIGIGGAALGVGGWLPWLLVGGCYAGFAGLVVLALARWGGVRSCGCFGAPDTPPSVTHLVLAASASALALAVALSHPAGSPLAGLKDQPLLVAPFVVLTGCCAWFAYAAISLLPRTTGYMTRPE